MAVKFGVLVPQGWHLDLESVKDPVDKFEAMVRVGVEAERLGFDSIWVYDHFHTVPYAKLETNFECWIATAALARETSRVRIGQLVTCNSYRPPSLLAKMASTVDVLSHGRLDFGIGAGWYEQEYLAYGYPFPDGPERLRMLGEALQILHAMWTEPNATFEGKYYHIENAINEPKGVQKPHIPIWVGGGGEKVTLKLVAKYADACNVGGVNPDFYRHKFDVLRQHCEDVGRDYDSIIKSAEVFTHLVLPGQTAEAATTKARKDAGTLVGRDISLEEFREGNFVGYPQGFIGSTQEAVEVYKSLIDAGVEYFVVYLSDVVNLDTLHAFAEEVLPAFRDGG
ncbi:MAG: LLM class F420-dependent oxidoreductase [Chloroflexota bacterium]|nr:LLM class F420-dependent oxidoreductase [Chloroflexota bacterium]